MHYIYGKNISCYRQFGQVQQLELKYMAIDLEEVYICLLVWKGGNSCGILTGLLLNMHEQGNAMKSDSIRVLQSYLFLVVPNTIYTAFSLPGDLLKAWSGLEESESSPFSVCLLTIHQIPPSTLIPLARLEAKSCKKARLGKSRRRGNVYKVWKTNEPVFPRVSCSSGNPSTKCKFPPTGRELKWAKNTLKVSLVIEKSPSGTGLYHH